MNCGTCFFFSRYNLPKDINYRGARAGTCGNCHFKESDDPPVPIGGLRYWDYEGFSAGFEVDEAFGCVYWQTLLEVK